MAETILADGAALVHVHVDAEVLAQDAPWSLRDRRRPALAPETAPLSCYASIVTSLRPTAGG